MHSSIMQDALHIMRNHCPSQVCCTVLDQSIRVQKCVKLPQVVRKEQYLVAKLVNKTIMDVTNSGDYFHQLCNPFPKGINMLDITLHFRVLPFFLGASVTN